MKTLNTIDLFCGAGGAETGLEIALDRLGLRHNGLAINHWNVAVETMCANHSDVRTERMDLEAAVPSEISKSRDIDLLWASPTCTHHSRARGGKPRDNQLRAQPELVLTWLDQLYVRRIIIENVPEFVEWGPLGADGKPLKSAKGANFKAWIAAIEARQYRVEWRILNCADYGDATTRRRFFLLAVRKGCGKIAWPEQSHAEDPQPELFGPEKKRWRGIRECLDFSDTGRSIFDRKKPLAENTLRRIAVGIKRYCGLEFQMDMMGSNGNDESRIRSVDEPCATQHAGGNRTAIVRPFIVTLRNNATCSSVDDPIPTVTAYAEHHMVATPIVLDHFSGGDAKPVENPIRELTTVRKDYACFPRLEDGRIVDIRIRMLKPSELAAAHSFPNGYKLSGNKCERVKQIGNSVPCQTAAALCEAMLKEVAK